MLVVFHCCGYVTFYSSDSELFICIIKKGLVKVVFSTLYYNVDRLVQHTSAPCLSGPELLPRIVFLDWIIKLKNYLPSFLTWLFIIYERLLSMSPGEIPTTRGSFSPAHAVNQWLLFWASSRRLHDAFLYLMFR